MSLFRLAAGFCLLAASSPAAAQSVVFTAPRPGDALQAGSVVEVSWTGVPEKAEEMELLLSLDGGRRIALRLTGSLSASDHSYQWRVPNLRASRAALVLRMGIGGRETESGPSASFEILPDRSSRPEAVAWREGELWAGERPAPDEPESLPASSLDSRERRWTPLPDESAPAAPPGAAALVSRPSKRLFRARSERSTAAPSRCVLPRDPLSLSLRI